MSSHSEDSLHGCKLRRSAARTQNDIMLRCLSIYNGGVQSAIGFKFSPPDSDIYVGLLLIQFNFSYKVHNESCNSKSKKKKIYFCFS